MKIFPKLLIGALLISLTPFLTLALVVIRSTTQSSVHEEMNYLKGIAGQRVGALSEFFHVKEREVALLGHSNYLLELMPQLEEAVEKSAQTSQYAQLQRTVNERMNYFSQVFDFNQFTLVSLTGKILFTQDAEVAVGQQLNEGSSVLAKTFRDINTLLQPNISHLGLDPLSNKARILIGVPLFNLEKYIGTVIAQIPTESIYRFFQDYSGLGETGEVLVGYLDGEYMQFLIKTRHSPDEIFTIKLGADKAFPMQEAVRGRRGEGQSVDYRYESVLAVWDYFPYLNLGVVVKMDYSEALALSRGLKITISTIAVIFIIVICLVAYMLSRTISRPLGTLEKNMERVSKGDLSETEVIDGKDEISSVSRSFKTMIGKLRDSTTSIAELNQEVERRKALESQMTDFFSVMTHELRGPITPITEGIQIALEGEVGQNERRFLEKALANAKRLHHLSSELLDFRSLSEGKIQYRMKQEDLNSILEEAAKLLSFPIEKKGLQLVMPLADNLPEVFCDRTRILQVVTNLLNNATKFTTKGSITIRSLRDDGHLRVEITDTGPGIAKEDIGKIFQRFTQLQAAKDASIAGTGLGLVIAKEIIEQHEGTIWVESVEGSGTSFFFTLPIKQPETPQEDAS